MLLSGAIDILPTLTASSRRELENQQSLQLHPQTSPAWNVLLIQTDDPLLQDLKMRQAIAHAIDVEMVSEAATYGFGKPNPSAVPVHSKYHTELHDSWLDYDPEKARALLRDAGYDGSEIKLQTNKRFQSMFDQAIAIQAMLNAAGMNVSLEVLDWATHLSNYFNGRFQLSSFGYSARTDPTSSYGMFVGSKEENAFVQWGSVESTRLVSRSETVLGRAARQDIFDELHTRMKADVPIIGLYNAYALQVTNRSVQGYKSWPLLIPRAWGVWKQEAGE